MVRPENTCTGDIVQMKKVIFMTMQVYTCMHLTTKGGHRFEGAQGRVCGKV